MLLSIYAPRQTDPGEELHPPGARRRLYPAILWNLLLLPLGYYYLRDTRRFWLFTLLSLLSGLYGVLIARLLPEALWGWPTLVTLLGSAIGFHVFIIGDTIATRARARPSESGYFRRPQAYYFLFLYVPLFLGAGVGVEEVRDRILKSHSIPSRSMAPSLLAGDYVFFDYLAKPGDLRAGDIVAYAPSGDPEKVFAHRLVGLPGDRIRLSSETIATEQGAYAVTRIERNGTRLPLRQVRLLKERPARPSAAVSDALPVESDFDAVLNESPQGQPVLLMEEIGERSHLILETGGQLFVERPLPAILPPDQFLLLGDNRDDSKDSRITGLVSAEQIRGRYMYTYFSVNWRNRSCDAYRRLVQQAQRRGDFPNVSAEVACPAGLLARLGRAQIRWHRVGFRTP